MKDKGLALLLLFASVGFMVWTATSRTSRGGMKATRGEKQESIAPLGNQPFLPDREPFTVGYERREEVHTPLTAMPKTEWESSCAPPAVSASETVAVSCEGGNCEFKEQPPMPQAEIPQAPHPQPMQQPPIPQAPPPEMQQPPMPQAPPQPMQQPPMPQPPMPQAPPPEMHQPQEMFHPQPPVREGFGDVPRRRAVRDISHANPFMR